MKLDKRVALMESLGDPDYRRALMEEHIGQGLAFQIRALRDKHEWTQDQLASRTGQKQETISQLENPDYGRYSLTTLKKLAAAFDTALIVRFAPFSDLVEWIVNLAPDKLAPASYTEEQEARFARMHALAGASLLTATLASELALYEAMILSASDFPSLRTSGERLEELVINQSLPLAKRIDPSQSENKPENKVELAA